jgi:beta-lactamase regulating signal transducer with metallopeptidase domain
MIALLDSIGLAIVHASCQAALLALVVGAITRLSGERIAPRWRYLLWSVVVCRLLLVTTPASPWSVFNLARFLPRSGAAGTAPHEEQPKREPDALSELLVTPESISPCVVGTIRPRIVVPESIVTDSPDTMLRHVLAHERAHIARGDLWANWLLLVAPIVHWFNPVAWWVVREMQAEREAACDDFALAALAECDRSSYASTIVDLATTLAPSGVAPAMIGLIASSRRLTSRVQRLARSAPTKSLRAPIAASVAVAIAMIGLTDAMPLAATHHAAPPAGEVEQATAAEREFVTLRGRCEDADDKTPIAGAVVRLFKAPGRTAPIVEVAK